MAMPVSAKGIIAIFSNGFFYILSWVLFFEGARHVAIRASMMACVEPLFAALLAMFFLSQILSVTEWIGFLLFCLPYICSRNLAVSMNKSNNFRFDSIWLRPRNFLCIFCRMQIL